jgi:XTP/dITP diphosphohydrolase
MKKLLIATSNDGKYKEIMEVLHEAPFEIVSLKYLGLNGDFEEIGSTHEEIALNKARYYQKQSGLLTLAEDSGIMVDALAGELGIKTRRWGAGEKAGDEEWIEYFLNVMKAVPGEKRTARFICCSAVVSAEGEANVFVGQTDGVITEGLEAPIYKGLPLSSCFRPKGFDKVYAALGIAEKNKVSHRGKAMQMVLSYLKTLKD